MIVVSDTSVISNLAQIDHLALLHDLYGQIIVPIKVLDELKAHRSTMTKLTGKSWLTSQTITDSALYKELEESLDPGEAEAIVLAKELDAELLLIDERKGRQIAKEHGLQIVGLLGVLIDAKRMGRVTSLKPLMDRLINEASFWISPKLYQSVLAEVGEDF